MKKSGQLPGPSPSLLQLQWLQIKIWNWNLNDAVLSIYFVVEKIVKSFFCQTYLFVWLKQTCVQSNCSKNFSKWIHKNNDLVNIISHRHRKDCQLHMEHLLIKSAQQEVQNSLSQLHKLWNPWLYSQMDQAVFLSLHENWPLCSPLYWYREMAPARSSAATVFHRPLTRRKAGIMKCIWWNQDFFDSKSAITLVFSYTTVP